MIGDKARRDGAPRGRPAARAARRPPWKVNGSPTSADMINTAIAINSLKDSQTAATVLRAYDFTVAVNHTNSDSTLVPSDGSTPQIDWDPNLAHQVYSADYKAGIQSPAMALAHEIAHVLGMDENQATAFETQIALELGEPTRGNYQLVTQEKIYVENSTEHSANG
ncbi:hypothetical protein [Rugamonas sp. DEMB1]|uniref:hypothetical protein n=1 Tax=Rugamonas sp. DEMB1 TaxID=3039386 RepID=UPI0024491FF3|nr:hypothetical protein [Rugamonas sp. DEMB1]WGG50898.1 hypothetical protein QC826_00870 [Rugamonas sp. DEMB1]